MNKPAKYQVRQWEQWWDVAGVYFGESDGNINTVYTKDENRQIHPEKENIREWTGTFDKNGRPIYDGMRIVRLDNYVFRNERDFVYTVSWCDNMGCWKATLGGSTFMYHLWKEMAEIVVKK